MESWRERGYVPDSDSEDGFDSQDLRALTNNDDDEDVGIGVPVLADAPTVPAEETGPVSEASDDGHVGDQAGHNLGNGSEYEDDGSQGSAASQRAIEGDTNAAADLYGTQIGMTTNAGDADVDMDLLDESNVDQENQAPILPAREERTDSRSSPDLPTAPVSNPPSTPRAEEINIWDVPSSSPDEIQFEFEPTLKTKSLPTTAEGDEGTQPANDNTDLSPLSSPPSSLASFQLGEDGQDPQNDEDQHNGGEQAEIALGDLLPHLDIPEDILQELDQPMRRSLRQRNPIQLRPYQLELAKYQSTMKARGIKPLRIAQYQQALRDAANASQSQNAASNPGLPSSSPATDFEPLPSSPVDSRQVLDRRPQNTPGRPRQRDPQPLDHSSIDRTVPSAKRRKVSHGAQNSPQPRVVIDNSATPRGLDTVSVWDVPPSPPRSGSVSSTKTAKPSGGFRFPPGFTPPTVNTPNAEARLGTKNDDDVMAVDWMNAGLDQDPEDAESLAPHSGDDSNSEREDGKEGADADNRAVLALRRRIKGVLPASWLRLDQAQQKQKLPTAAQRHREALLRADSSKGVAKRIAKRIDPTTARSPRRQLTALNQLADDDDSSDGSTHENAHSMDNSRHILAKLVGADDPFRDEDAEDDIPEDNRIDDIFPSIPSGRPSGIGETRTKRQRPERDSMNSESYRKRARLKRQTRITDSAYGTQKAKRPPTRAPRRGILDVLEVVERPRKEQPLFLRIAARQARSRRDGGRTSPTGKFVKLSSRLDTEDASMSLREWRKGEIPQQRRLTQSQPRPRPRKRQTLVDFLARKRDSADHHSARGISVSSVINAGHTVGRTENNAATAPASNSNSATTPALKRNIASRRTVQPEPRGNQWVVRRNLAISSLKRSAPRPAEPETISSEGRATPSLFQRSLSALNRDYRQQRTSRANHSDLPLDRFLSDSAPSTAPGNRQNASPQDASLSNGAASRAQPQTRRRQLKKRPPKRLDIGAVEHQEPPTFWSPTAEPFTAQAQYSRPSNHAIDGLKSFQRSYSVDFNIHPLRSGTFFHESTFIGSGEFSRSLSVVTRDLDKDAGTFHIIMGSRSLRWGAWNDTVSSELGVVFEKLTDEAEKNAAAALETDFEGINDQGCPLYRSLVKYVTEHLTFIDPIDRTGFTTRANGLVSDLNDHLTTLLSTTTRCKSSLMRMNAYNLVFANQIRQVACHNLVNETIANEAFQLVKSVSKQLVAFISSRSGVADGQGFLEANKLQERRDAGIRDDHPAVEAYVIAQHVLHSKDTSKGWLEDFITEVYVQSESRDASKVKEIPRLENGWHGLFTTLPLNEIDLFGIVRIGSRFKESHDNWKMVQQLLIPVLDDYDSNSAAQPFSYNNYCRVLFHRCFHLINGWGWRDCRTILNTLYNFFATKTSFYNLKHEESFGSPAFLDDLDRNPSLDVLPGDPCFHILLKIIGTGLRFLSKIYNKKKISNFAWCLLPNHGRVYPKELDIRREDLNALRNHHDLLCTVYFAVPDGCRPRLEMIRDLVHPASSHREACNISIRAWTRLVRFKLSTDEDISGLDAFADWHSYFVTELLKQHTLARKEIEAQSGGGTQFSHREIERIISQNQQQIELLLSTALSGLQGAVELSPTLQHAQKIVSSMPIRALLSLFNPRHTRVNSIVSGALQVMGAYIQKCSPPSGAETVQPSADEDSQEFGGWVEFEDMYGDEPHPPDAEIDHVEKVFHPAVSRLVSNCFGEDHCPDDAILLSVVECWACLAQTLVAHGLRHWENYISPYDGDSWAALRSTVQTRKFTPQFLASCIEKDARFMSECRTHILGMWLSSLVERASMLKFQHRLTEAIMNRDRTNHLLQNLPFSRDRKNERYSVTLNDFTQRRVSLISSLLSNMRERLQDMEDAEDRDLSITKQEYKELIQRLMSSMKANYQELGNGTQSIQGAYVDFVHRVVGFLQQHTRDICPIDPFFTDPTSFPLPSTDPTYIVARLKSYEPKLATEKFAKTLIMFTQGVSERAAIDGQQDYLVDQLHASMENTYEGGNANKPTLRAILLQCVFPAYLETAFSNPAAWVLSRPILQTVSLLFKDLLFNMDATDPSCVSSVVNMFDSIFQSSYQALHQIADDPSMLKQPPVLVTTTAFFEMISSAMRVIDYIDRATNLAGRAVIQIQAFRGFALFVASRLHGQDLADDEALGDFIRFSSSFFPATNPETDKTTAPVFFHEARQSAARELQAYISESWSQHQGKYYFTRRGGHQPQEIGIEPSVAAKLDHLPEAECDEAIGDFLNTLKALDLLEGV